MSHGNICFSHSCSCHEKRRMEFNGRTLYVHTNPIQLPHALIPVCIRIVNSPEQYQKLLQEFERTGETIGSIQWG